MSENFFDYQPSYGDKELNDGRKHRVKQKALENESRKAFDQYVPSEWISRTPEDDVGVDQNIEVCVNNLTTGLHFNVQLKSTENEDRRLKAPIAINDLLYLQSLAVPAMIVHYHKPSAQLFWMWIWEALSQVRDYGNKEITIQFSEVNLVEEGFARSVLSTLRSHRNLMVNHHHSILKINASDSGLNYLSKISLKSSVDYLEDFSHFNPNFDNERFIPLAIHAEGDEFTVSLDQLVSLTVVGNSESKRPATDDLLFSLVNMFSALRLDHHATAVATYIAKNCLTTDNSVWLAQTALALMGEPRLCLLFIRTNKIYRNYNRIFVYLLGVLGANWTNDDLKYLAKFLRDAYDLGEMNPRQQLFVHYRMANAYAVLGEHRIALNAYLALVRQNRRYMRKPLVLDALWCLIKLGKFKVARKLLHRTRQFFSASEFSGLSAEVDFFQGNFTSASALLEPLCEQLTSPIVAEHRLKLALMSLFGSNTVLQDFIGMGGVKWEEKYIQTFADSTNPQDQIVGNLIRVLFIENDIYSWAVAIGMSAGNTDRRVFDNAYALGVFRCGYGLFYQLARGILQHPDNDHSGLEDEESRKLFDFLEALAVSFKAYRDEQSYTLPHPTLCQTVLNPFIAVS